MLDLFILEASKGFFEVAIVLDSLPGTDDIKVLNVYFPLCHLANSLFYDDTLYGNSGENSSKDSTL